jgi:hypothetical protein
MGDIATVTDEITRRDVKSFLIKATLLIALVYLPYPGLANSADTLFHSLVRVAFDPSGGARRMEFDTIVPGQSRIVVINKQLMNSQGAGPIRNIDIDSLGFVWRPLGFLTALILAAPVSRPRKLAALLLGFASLYLLLLAEVSFIIWSESAEIGLVSLPIFWLRASDALTAELGSEVNGVAAPFFIWVVVTFKQKDLTLLRRSAAQT